MDIRPRIKEELLDFVKAESKTEMVNLVEKFSTNECYKKILVVVINRFNVRNSIDLTSENLYEKLKRSSWGAGTKRNASCALRYITKKIYGKGYKFGKYCEAIHRRILYEYDLYVYYVNAKVPLDRMPIFSSVVKGEISVGEDAIAEYIKKNRPDLKVIRENVDYGRDMKIKFSNGNVIILDVDNVDIHYNLKHFDNKRKTPTERYDMFTKGDKPFFIFKTRNRQDPYYNKNGKLKHYYKEPIVYHDNIEVLDEILDNYS